MDKDSISNAISKGMRVAMMLLVLLWSIGCFRSMFE